MIKASNGAFSVMICGGIAVDGQRLHSTESYLGQSCSPGLCEALDLILGEPVD